MAWFMNRTCSCARAVPGLGVVGELAVERRIGAERIHQRRLVVGRAAHPAVGHARPVRDGVALADHVLARARDAEKFVGETAGAGIGRTGQHVLGLGVVQRIVEPRDRARGVAERRMHGDIVDPLAVDIDLTTIAQAFEVFLAGERQPERHRTLGPRSSILLRPRAERPTAPKPSVQSVSGARRSASPALADSRGRGDSASLLPGVGNVGFREQADGKKNWLGSLAALGILLGTGVAHAEPPATAGVIQPGIRRALRATARLGSQSLAFWGPGPRRWLHAGKRALRRGRASTTSSGPRTTGSGFDSPSSATTSGSDKSPGSSCGPKWASVRGTDRP